jgi:hypothetical protein
MTNESANAAVPLFLSLGPIYCICELPDFLVRDISRHEICDRLTNDETADEC